MMTGVQFEALRQWPKGHERTPAEARDYSRFRSTYSQTTDLLEGELEKIGAENIVLQVDMAEGAIRRDGLPYANARIGVEDSGVVLSFDTEQGHFMYPCDTYRDWRDNLRAIALTLEHLRAVDRYGVSKSGEQYVGWRALPADVDEGMTRKEAATILVRTAGMPEAEREAMIEGLAKAGGNGHLRRVYRKAAAMAHPDRGGTKAAFHRVQTALQVLEAS